MAAIDKIGRVLVPVTDQDRAIAFYTGPLGFTLVADMPFGQGSRWVEVAPPGGGTTVALVPPQGDFAAPRSTGIGFHTPDARASHAALVDAGVDVDAELTGGDGTVPALFFFRDGDGNQFLLAESQG